MHAKTLLSYLPRPTRSEFQHRSSTEARKDIEFAKGIPENTFQEPRQPAPPVYAVHIGKCRLCLTTSAALTVADHTIDGGYRRAKRHLTDEEIAKYIASGEWRVRIVK